MSFSDEVFAFEKFAEKQIGDDFRAMAIDLFSSIIEDTPVLEGRLKGNWNTSIGSPDLNESDVKDPSGGMTTQKMQRVVLSQKGEQPVFIANNLPYAEVIEMGGPGRTPRRMVGKNILRVATNANRGGV